MKLIICRHGESEENSFRILQGLVPGKLSSVGLDQANKLGVRLAGEKIDLIYCSPIGRCKETLAIIQKYIGTEIPVVFSQLIQERDFGQMSGKSLTEINFDDLDVDNEVNRRLGVESLESVAKRTGVFLAELKKEHPDKDVLIISHSNTMRMLFTHLLNMTFQEVLKSIKIHNASVSIFEINQTITPIAIDETEFLL